MIECFVVLHAGWHLSPIEPHTIRCLIHHLRCYAINLWNMYDFLQYAIYRTVVCCAEETLKDLQRRSVEKNLPLLKSNGEIRFRAPNLGPFKNHVRLFLIFSTPALSLSNVFPQPAGPLPC